MYPETDRPTGRPSEERATDSSTRPMDRWIAPAYARWFRGRILHSHELQHQAPAVPTPLTRRLWGGEMSNIYRKLRLLSFCLDQWNLISADLKILRCQIFCSEKAAAWGINQIVYLWRGSIASHSHKLSACCVRGNSDYKTLLHCVQDRSRSGMRSFEEEQCFNIFSTVLHQVLLTRLHDPSHPAILRSPAAREKRETFVGAAMRRDTGIDALETLPAISMIANIFKPVHYIERNLRLGQSIRATYK